MTEAAEAAAHWGVELSPRLVTERENAVYEVVLPNGERAALRLHRPGYQSAGAIRSELWWMEALAAAGVPVPRPVRTRDGALLAETGDRLATVVTWLEGDQMGEGDTPLPGDAAAVKSQYHELGALLARVHNETDLLRPPSRFERPVWDRAGFLGETPLWGRFWESPALDPEERRTLDAARVAAAGFLERFAQNGADQGLIHADVLRENVLIDADEMALIDFDDCGFGFRAYDLATALVQALDDPMYPVARDALHGGYAAWRRASVPDTAEIEAFVALRAFASAGWIVSRAAPDSPRTRFYAERAVRASRFIPG